jgi:hypothetical protein
MWGRMNAKKLHPGSKELGVVVVNVLQLTFPGAVVDVNADGKCRLAS